MIVYNLFALLLLQKLENRGLVVKETELPRWKQLTIFYMSEESDDNSDPQSIVLHQLEWRSKRKPSNIASS